FGYRADPAVQARSLQGIVILLALVLAVAIAGFEVWTASIARDGQLEETKIKVRNLASLVAEHAERSIEAADIVLRSIADRIETDRLEGSDQPQLHAIVGRRAAELAQVAAFTIIDAKGQVVVSSQPVPLDPDTADSQYFRFHRDHPNAGLHVSGPIPGRGRGRSVFIASRAFKAPDGGFGGIVLAALQTQFFQDFYDGIDTGANGLILLASDVGGLIARHPDAREMLGREALAGTLLETLPPLDMSAFGRIVSPEDSIARWSEARRLQNSNLSVVAALSEYEELAVWRSQTTDQIIAIGAILLTISGFSAYLVRQIGKRTKAEREAAAHAIQYKLLADNSTDIIMRIGFDGIRRYVSPSARAVLGYEPEEMMGQQAGGFTDADDRKRMQAAWDRLRRAQGMQIITSRIRHKRGHSIWVETLVSAIHDPQTGQPVEMVAVMREISTRKAIEAKLVDAVRELASARDAADQAARAKSRFLAAMSHEIRTPLNTVIGFAELMQKTAPAEDYRRYAELQLEAGTSLLGLINDILDFSKLESGELALLPAAVDIVTLIETCVENHQPAARAKGLDLRCSVATTLPRRIASDGPRLRQILDNLLSNAVKFTRSGTISLVAQRTGTQAAPRLRIAVSDSGIGIEEEKIGLIFQRFTQLDAEIDRQFGGTGLGLAISQFLARYMDGEITVESEVGRGSTFTLDLPLQVTEAELREPPAVSAKGTPELCFDILVAEDDKANQRLIAALLAEAGCTADVVDNGGAAVEAVTKHRYDLVLMDVAMPLVDGFQAAERIRALKGEAGAVPIIALTAHVLPSDAERCAAVGMQAHIGKPINRRELLAAIATHARKPVAAAASGNA